MKKFENKKIELTFEENVPLGFADIAVICLNQIPEGGLPPKEMAERLTVLGKFNTVKIGTKIDLEDAHFEILKQCADTTRWNLIHEDLVSFHDYLEKINNKK